MNPSATVVTTHGSVHDGSHMPVVFVGVTALVPLVWDHSVDADIGLGPPVYPRPFRGGDLSHIRWIVTWYLFFCP